MKNNYISNYTWFKTGGMARNIFRPKSLEEMVNFFKNNKDPYLIIGAGSNIMVSDDGFDGTVILTSRLRAIKLLDNHQIYCESGVMGLVLAKFAGQHSISGLEFLSTIPGTIGGNIRMNAGCNGKSIMNCLIETMCLKPSGEIVTLKMEECGFGYRYSAIPKNWFILSGVLQGHQGNKEKILNTIESMFVDREKRQPIGIPSVGSTFKNPLPHFAWKVIEDAGFRGYKHKSVKVSEKHCNFITHNEDYTQEVKTEDFLELVEIIKKKVLEISNIQLELEVIVY